MVAVFDKKSIICRTASGECGGKRWDSDRESNSICKTSDVWKRREANEIERENATTRTCLCYNGDRERARTNSSSSSKAIAVSYRL